MAIVDYSTKISDYHFLSGSKNTDNTSYTYTWLDGNSNSTSLWSDAIIIAFTFQINRSEQSELTNNNTVSIQYYTDAGTVVKIPCYTTDNNSFTDTYDNTKKVINTSNNYPAFTNKELFNSVDVFSSATGVNFPTDSTQTNAIYKNFYAFIPKTENDEYVNVISNSKLRKNTSYNVRITIKYNNHTYSKTVAVKTGNDSTIHYFTSTTDSDTTIYNVNTYTYSARVKKDITQYQNGLYTLNTNIIDTTPSSPNYFCVTKCDDELMLGMTDFHFHLNPLYFKSEYPVYIELLDYNGNPVYYEIATERNNLYNNTYIVFYVTSDTAQGPATLTLAGHIDTDADGNTYDDYDYINIKWIHNVYINPNKINNSDIIFSNTPIVRKIENTTQNQYINLQSKQSHYISELLDVKTEQFTKIPIVCNKYDVASASLSLVSPYTDSTGNYVSCSIKYTNSGSVNSIDDYQGILQYTVYTSVSHVPRILNENITIELRMYNNNTNEYEAITPLYINTGTVLSLNWEYRYIISGSIDSSTYRYITLTQAYTNEYISVSWCTYECTDGASTKLTEYSTGVNEFPTYNPNTDTKHDYIKIVFIDNTFDISSDTLLEYDITEKIATNNIHIFNNDSPLKSITRKYKDSNTTIQTSATGYFIDGDNNRNKLVKNDTWIELPTNDTDDNSIYIDVKTAYQNDIGIIARPANNATVFNGKYINLLISSELYADTVNDSLTSCCYDYDAANNISSITFQFETVDIQTIKNTLNNIYVNNSYVEVPASSFDDNNIYSDANIHLLLSYNNNNTLAIELLDKNEIADNLYNCKITIYSNSYLMYNVVTSNIGGSTLVDTYIPSHLDIINPENLLFGMVYVDKTNAYSGTQLSQNYITFEITNFTPMQGYINSINCYWRDNRFDWIVVKNTDGELVYIPKYHLLDTIDISSTYPTENSIADYNYGVGYNYNEIRFQTLLPKYSTPSSDEYYAEVTDTEPIKIENTIPCTIDYKFEFVNAYGKKCITNAMYIGDTYTE